MKFFAAAGAISGAVLGAVCSLPFAGWAYVGPGRGSNHGEFVGLIGIAALAGALLCGLIGLAIGWATQRRP